MNQLDFNTTVWITGFVGGLFALSGLLVAQSARGALPSVTRITIANCALTLSIIGRVWVGDDMTNLNYAALWTLWSGTLMAMVSAQRFAVEQPNIDDRLFTIWLTVSAGITLAAISFTSPQPTAIMGCVALVTVATTGCWSALHIRNNALTMPRLVLAVAFGLTALATLWHLPLRIADLVNAKPSIEQTAYTYVMFLGIFLSLNMGLILVLYSRVIEDVGSLAYVDQLTSALNRHGLRAHLREYRHTKGRYMQGTLVLIDIDHFKQVNDTHGHDTGDTVLARVSARLKRYLGDKDLLVRWGGEEFCLILPDRAVDQACELAQQICEDMAAGPLQDVGPENLTVTISSGVTALGQNGEQLKEDMQRADEALYTAKRNGRNQVQRWSREQTSAIHPYDSAAEDKDISLAL